MRDVAKAAGVSLKTVSRVHNNDPNVAPATRERVEAAMKDLGYLPNELAATFRKGTSPLVGVVVPSITDPFFASLIQAIDEAVTGADLMTVVAAVAHGSEERTRVEALLNRRLRGLVIAPSSHDHSYLGPWSAQLPIVFVDRAPENFTADSITSDDAAATARAVAHLITEGHRSIGFVGDDASITTTRARLGGYRESLAAAGLTSDDALVAFHGDDPSQTPRLVRAMLDAAGAPTAVLCSNARAAMAIAPALAALGVALVSFGDFPLADAVGAGITALDQSPAAIGALAAARVLDRVENPEAVFEPHQTVATTLIVRGTSRPPVGPADNGRPHR